MNISDLFRQQQQYVATQEQLDTFINRCMDEKDETLYLLGVAIERYYNSAPVLSFVEVGVYPQVLERIQARLREGER